ncbi:Hypothetical predicted protein, partial [Marmota monax]
HQLQYLDFATPVDQVYPGDKPKDKTDSTPSSLTDMNSGVTILHHEQDTAVLLFME